MLRWLLALVCVLLAACGGTEQAEPRATTPHSTQAAGEVFTTTSATDATTSSTTAPAKVERWARLPNGPVTPGLGTSAVWAGTELVILGGMPSGKVEEAGMTSAAAAYDPERNTWRALPAVPGAGRSLHATVWTGTEVIVWGGRRTAGYGSDGAAYNPQSNRWRVIAASPLPGRENAMVVWTGQEMIVWGGNRNWEPLADGAAYNPATDSWRPLPAAPLDGRWGSATAWTGKEVLIWGGNGGKPDEEARARGEGYITDRADGAAYSPAANTWRKLSRGPLGPRIARGVWADGELRIFGGRRDDEGGGSSVTDGAAYDPVTDSWRPLKDPQPPAGVTYRGAPVWTGKEMLVPGEQQGRSRWVAYQPATDSWRVLPLPPRVDNFGPSAVWAGDELLVWGALYNCSLYADCTASVTGQAGLRYFPPC